MTMVATTQGEEKRGEERKKRIGVAWAEARIKERK
jgi:hypothetical protein